jgi:hypothetical protein
MTSRATTSAVLGALVAVAWTLGAAGCGSSTRDNGGGPPDVTSVSPASGSLAGGTQATLTGSGFSPGATVEVGGIAASNVAVLDADTITFFVPAGLNGGGTKDVTVSTDGGSATLVRGFTYSDPPPTIASISPRGAALGIGLWATVTGTGFFQIAPSYTGGAGDPPAPITPRVTVGGIPVQGVTVFSSTSLSVLVPDTPAGANDVVVTNPDGKSSTLAGGFSRVGASSLKFVQMPTSVRAGQYFSLALAVVDGSGNTITDATGNVHFTMSSAPSGVSLGGYTDTGIANGVTTNAALSVSGPGTSFTVVATYNSLTATSPPFTAN